MNTAKKNYIFNILLTAFNILFPVISFPYAAKILGPVGVGKVQFILSFSQYFGLIAALGIPIYGVRLISQSAHDSKLLFKNLSELLSIHIICSLTITIGYVLILLSFDFFHTDRLLFFLSGTLILMSFTSIDWYFSGIENFKLIAVRSVSVKLISLIFLFLFVKARTDYGIYLAVSLFSIIGNNVVNLISIRKNIKISLKGIRKHLRPLMYTFGTTVATSMYTILDAVLIGFLANERSVGLYSASIKLTKISIPFIISSATVLMPRISKLFAGHDFETLNIILNKSFSFITIIAIPICVSLLFLAPQLIYLFSGSQFNEAVLTMRILSPLTLIISLGYFWGFQILIPSGKEREMLISVFCGMVFNLSLNFILIPFFKQNGSAFANVVSELIVTLSYMYFCLKIIPFKISGKPLLYSVLATLPFIFLFLITRLLTRNLNMNMYYSLLFNLIFLGATYFFIQIKIFKNSILREISFNFLLKRR